MRSLATVGIIVLGLAAMAWPLSNLANGGPRSESEIALAYSCGFVTGQSITLGHSDDPKGSCPEFKKLAARHGFHP